MRTILAKIQSTDTESDCIIKIFDYYHDEILNHQNQEIPISLLMIKLMKILGITEDKSLITKALIITIQFFEQIPADLYDNQGIEIDLLPLKYKKKAIAQLRQEFLLN
ncbi:hypothetical protein LCGC14_1566060 [marine sediment metagenome]|uniref:Uncharacterized protein n=1 Tax=marine sediment metagenome TaxID=412755 RepID=A0A0F9IL08_9ZZZZ